MFQIFLQKKIGHLIFSFESENVLPLAKLFSWPFANVLANKVLHYPSVTAAAEAVGNVAMQTGSAEQCFC